MTDTTTGDTAWSYTHGCKREGTVPSGKMGEPLSRQTGSATRPIWRKGLCAIGLAPLLLLGACGNDPPCGESGITGTVRNFAAKYVITIGIPAKFPDNVDLSSPVELSAITTHSWDPNTKTAVCTSRYRLDQTALIQEAKAKSRSLNDSTLRSGIEKLPDRGVVVDGALAYSVKRTTDGQWWIEILDMRPD